MTSAPPLTLTETRDRAIRAAQRAMVRHRDSPPFALSVALRRLHDLAHLMEHHGAAECYECHETITVPENAVRDPEEILWIHDPAKQRQWCSSSCHEASAETYWTAA